MPMSRAMRSALAAVARMKGDGDVAAADLKKALFAALSRQPDVDDDDADGDDRDERLH